MERQRFREVVLVGKNTLLREGLAGILREGNLRIAASVSNANDLRQSKARHGLLLYLIVHTGDNFDIALEQIKCLRNRSPDARIAIVADRYRINELELAFRAGAHGYFVNISSCDRFIRSIELVMMGETIFPPASLSFMLDANRSHVAEAAAGDLNGEEIAAEDAAAPLLSPREQVILRCITEGASNKSIARKMDITEATVKTHVKAILRKIRVKNRTQAAIWGIQNGSHAQPEIG